MSNRQNYCNTNFVLLFLGLSEVAQNLHIRQGRPYADTPFVILPGMLKSSQPIEDDPNLCMAFNFTHMIFRYSHMYIYIYIYVYAYVSFIIIPGAIFQFEAMCPLNPFEVYHAANGFYSHHIPMISQGQYNITPQQRWCFPVISCINPSEIAVINHLG